MSDRVGTALRSALAAGVLGDDEPSAVLYDLDLLRMRLDEVAAAFPGLPTFAVKAAPIARLLEHVLDAGFGLEVASEGEVALAAAVGAPPDRVVFDSPAKTRAEIADALGRGLRINANHLAELERIASLRDGASRAPSIGLRVNPGVTGATIAATFTGGRGAKFGHPLDDEAAIVAAFDRWPWLDGLHVHVGSQGVPLEVLVDGVARVVALADRLAARGRAPAVLDIGGGLPARYRPDDRPPTFAAYAAALCAAAPSVLAGPWRVITEFGRAIAAPAGVVVSRVEYARDGLAILHVGADLFVRTAYRPEQWHHEIAVFAADGTPKGGPAAPWTVAGPLCFSGDVLARDRSLPPIAEGDVVVVADAGAYTLSMWSRYNSRRAPAVWGYRGDPPRFELLKPREPLADVLRFWGVDG